MERRTTRVSGDFGNFCCNTAIRGLFLNLLSSPPPIVLRIRQSSCSISAHRAANVVLFSSCASSIIQNQIRKGAEQRRIQLEASFEVAAPIEDAITRVTAQPR